uniref:Uncharacterized protein n=1 Tax=Apteryx owenii TaxID=8824 RepID=A0A8B9QLP7_APTOW
MCFRPFTPPISSSCSWQSGTPSHFMKDGIHPFEGHRNSVCLQDPGDSQVGVFVGQFISSLPSTQSSASLHFAVRGKHCCTYTHLNWSLLQVGGRGSAASTNDRLKINILQSPELHSGIHT